MSAQKIDLIRQALSAAESSIKLACQLLSDLEQEGFKNKPKAKELPGTIGVFDGQGMMTESGEKFSVPENYASKSILVVGDTLKLVEEGGEKRFKQIEHVKRHKTTGILAKKDGKWAAVSSEGSYKVLPASVAHFEGDVGDEALLQLPANSLQVPWAAVEKITKKGGKTATLPARPAGGPAGRQGTETAEKKTDDTGRVATTEARKEEKTATAEEQKKPKEEPKIKEEAKAEDTKETKEKEEDKDKKTATPTVGSKGMGTQKGTETQKVSTPTTTESPDKRTESTEKNATTGNNESKTESTEKITAATTPTIVETPKEAEVPEEAAAAEPQKTSEAPKEPEAPKEAPKTEAVSEDELA
jgi:hypothetical protein